MSRWAVTQCADLGEASAFYHAAGYTCPVSAVDTVWVVHHAGELIGAVRLVLEDGTLVLRGMQVERRYQRKGVGSKLLDATVVEIGERECWCLPYDYLRGFYADAGFSVEDGSTIPASTIPAFLAERAKRYNEQGRSVVVMRRPAP